ncbi:hypothetical protein [Chryseobacterium sp. M5A1_1a]
MKNFLGLFVLLPIIMSCFSNQKTKENKSRAIKVIKFMNTVNEYPFDYGEKMFWDNPEEHAVIYDTHFNIMDEVASFNSSDSKKFKNYKYCFIIPSSLKNDTLYSDFTLKAWIIKKNGTKEYYYDNTGKLANNLKGIYSFFYDCW